MTPSGRSLCNCKPVGGAEYLLHRGAEVRDFAFDLVTRGEAAAREGCARHLDHQTSSGLDAHLRYDFGPADPVLFDDNSCVVIVPDVVDFAVAADEDRHDGHRRYGLASIQVSEILVQYGGHSADHSLPALLDLVVGVVRNHLPCHIDDCLGDRYIPATAGCGGDKYPRWARG